MNRTIDFWLKRNLFYTKLLPPLVPSLQWVTKLIVCSFSNLVYEEVFLNIIVTEMKFVNKKINTNLIFYLLFVCVVCFSCSSFKVKYCTVVSVAFQKTPLVPTRWPLGWNIASLLIGHHHHRERFTLDVPLDLLISNTIYFLLRYYIHTSFILFK